MNYYKLSDEQKLRIIERKVSDVQIIIKIITDALEFRVYDEPENHNDCIGLLRKSLMDLRCIKKLF